MNQIYIKKKLYIFPALLFCMGLQGTETTQQNSTAQANSELSPDLYNYVNEQNPEVLDTSINRVHNRPNRPKPKPTPKQQSSQTMHKKNQPGTLDLSFGNGKGYEVSPIGKAHVVTVQPDGKILVGGSSKRKDDTGSHQFCLARYTADGSLDPDFGPGHSGYIETNVGSDASIKAITIHPDGKIVVGGSGALAQYLSNGHLDTQFGGHHRGILEKNETGMQEITALVIQDDGKIIAGGENRGDSQITRFDQNGLIDKVFHTRGGNVWYMRNITTFLKTNGKIIAGGLGKVIVEDGDKPKTANLPVIMRYNIDGSLDTSFGNQGTGLSYPWEEDERIFDYNNVLSCTLTGSLIIILGQSILRNDYYLTSIFNSQGNGYQDKDEYIPNFDAKFSLYQGEGHPSYTGKFLLAAKSGFRIQKVDYFYMEPYEDFGNNGMAELKIPGKENITVSSLCFQGNNKFIAVGFTSDDEFIVAQYHN